jgi:hypothetical protein
VTDRIAQIYADGWSRIVATMIRFTGGDNLRMGILFWRRVSRSPDVGCRPCARRGSASHSNQGSFLD